jgi:hypothetical protein
MTLNPSTIGDNPQQPSIAAEIYNPDQLIAGHFKRVTSNVTITGGALLARGTVLGQVTINTTAGAPVPAGGNTGNGTIGTIVVGKLAKVGSYTVKFTAATTYIVLDPQGLELAPGTAAGAYGGSGLDPEIQFTFTAGGTAMVAGDIITIAVNAGGLGYKAAVATNTDGSQYPVAILADQADASAGDVSGGIYLTGEFNANALTFDVSYTLAQITAALRPLSIFVKNAVPADDPS